MAISHEIVKANHKIIRKLNKVTSKKLRYLFSSVKLWWFQYARTFSSVSY